MGASTRREKWCARRNGSGWKQHEGGAAQWRRGWDSNPRDPFESNGFQDRRLQPLGHPSIFCSLPPSPGESKRAPVRAGSIFGRPFTAADLLAEMKSSQKLASLAPARWSQPLPANREVRSTCSPLSFHLNRAQQFFENGKSYIVALRHSWRFRLRFVYA